MPAYGILAYYDERGKFHTLLTKTPEEHYELLLKITFTSDGGKLVREIVLNPEV